MLLAAADAPPGPYDEARAASLRTTPAPASRTPAGPDVAITPESRRLAQQIRVTLGQQVDAETRRLVAAWVREFNQLVPELQAALDDLATSGKDGRWPSRAQVARASRAQRALALAQQRLQVLATDAHASITNAVGDAVELAVTLEPRVLAAALPPQAGAAAELAATFDRIDPDAVDAIVRRSTEQITALTRPLSREAANVMRQELVRAVPLGTNPRDAATRILGRLEGAFNGGLTRALVITRTELLDAHRAGTQAQHKANSDLVTGWVWSAQLDARTCPSCWAQHGTEHPVDEFGPADHQQGRCARLPLTKTWREMGFDVDEPPSALPDAQTAFRALPEADQVKVMGAARLEGLRSGQIAWADLSTKRTTAGWRDSYAPTPVRRLAA